MIDPNRQYRTRDGRPVRIYATDGYPFDIHGAWLLSNRRLWALDRWHADGGHPDNPGLDLIEVTLADELRDQIPWEALRDEIRWVAMSGDKIWRGYYENGGEPFLTNASGMWQSGHHCALIGVRMPDVDEKYWQETLIERPKGV